jgi:hypothetical protein
VGIVVLFWLLFGIVTAVAAVNRGRSGFSWFFVGLLLGPFGLILVLVMSSKQEPGNDTSLPNYDTKTCPDCAEVIKWEARKCRFCGADINPESISSLERYLQDLKSSDPQVRGAAVMALGHKGGAALSVVEDLENMKLDPDACVRFNAKWAIRKIRKGSY